MYTVQYILLKYIYISGLLYVSADSPNCNFCLHISAIIDFCSTWPLVESSKELAGGGGGRRIKKIPSIIYLKCFFLIFRTICTQIIFKKFKVAKCTQNKLIPKNNFFANTSWEKFFHYSNFTFLESVENGKSFYAFCFTVFKPR